MKVLVDHRSPLCKLHELNPGEVFCKPDDEDVYMVCFEDIEKEPGQLYPNAVSMKTGELYCIGREILVERLHAVLHIR